MLQRQFGNICLGARSGGSEDCLYINVFTPSNATQNSKLPVWFYIQGGGYVQNAQANYNGTGVVNASGGNIVFVNINYRVGAFGFLASERIRADGDFNVGLLDQRKALEWVQKYIIFFGGDPDHVIIHGFSAGAGSVAHHLIAYGGRDDGLFIGAQPKVNTLEWQFDLYANQDGCSKALNKLNCLRSLNSSTLQKHSVEQPFQGRNSSVIFYWTPTVDKDLLQDYPYVLFEQGKFIHVPIMLGAGSNEGTLFVPNSSSMRSVSSFLQDSFPSLNDLDTAAAISLYSPPKQFAGHAAWFGAAAGAYGESVFTCPGIAISDAYTQHSPYSVWNYHYNVSTRFTAEGFGVWHTSETPAIFGVDAIQSGGFESSYKTYNSKMVPIMMDYWLSFVRGLNPNTFKSHFAPAWQTYQGELRILLQTNNSYMEKVPTSQRRRCDFWRQMAVKMEQ